MIRLPVGAKFLAFADDVAVVGTAEDTFRLKTLLETAASNAVRWLENIGLQISGQKTETIVLMRQRHRNDLTVDIVGAAISNRPYAVYLSITLDQKLSFTRHIQVQAEKADSMIQCITRILLNISAAKQRKKLLLSKCRPLSPSIRCPNMDPKNEHTDMDCSQ